MSGGEVELETSAGRLRGMAAPGVVEFLGVRYAEVPARFARAVPVRPHAGVRDALAFGPGCPQPDARVGASPQSYRVQRLLHPGVPTPLEGLPAAEDCCTLNVWTPALDGTPRPVMVWLHGGGDTQGTASEGWSHGDRLAAQGDVVVVSVNHRLGLLGYLGGEAGDDAADSGLLGLFDLVLALEWVRDNAAAFGGDPDRVTLFGQSGGAGKIAALMAMPAANGLFCRAILQSGVKIRAIEPDDAARTRHELEAILAAGGADLGSAPVEAIIAAQRAIEQRSPRSVGPVLHRTALPDHPFAHGAPAGAAHVAVLAGSTRHDSAMRLSQEPWFAGLEARDLPRRFAQYFPDADAGALLAHYRGLEPLDRPTLVLARACADATTRGARMHVMRAAKARQEAPVYAYRLDAETDVLGGVLGAPHCLDIPLVFGNADRSPFSGGSPDRFAVSDAMIQAWTSFARTGSPAADGLPEWPVFREASREQMLISAAPAVEREPPLPDVACIIQAGT